LPGTTNLDAPERQLVDQGVTYLNQVIRAAAVSAGVGYLDVENALVGHRLCDSPDAYVNAINLTNLTAPETFHPTAAGHIAEAQAIAAQLGGKDLADSAYCAHAVYPCPHLTDPPELPSFFADSSARPVALAIPSELFIGTNPVFRYSVEKGVEFVIQTSLLAAGSVAHIELHSDPLALGGATVGSDGSLVRSLTLPDTVPTGYHTLHIYGTSPSGEAVDIYQILYVADAVAGEPEQAQQADPSPSTVSQSDKAASAPVAAAPTCATDCQPSHSIGLLSAVGLLPATIGRNPVLAVIIVLMATGVILAVSAGVVWYRRRG
jgi:hypothetical protein